MLLTKIGFLAALTRAFLFVAINPLNLTAARDGTVMKMTRLLLVCGLLCVPSIARAQATQVFLQAAADASDLTAYTFASQSIGTAAADRCIIVMAHARAAGLTALSISSLTVAGQTVSNAVSRVSTQTNSSITALGSVVVSSGTTGDVVLTLSRGGTRASVALWRATGTNCTIADSGTSIATDPTFDLDVPANGFAIAACTWSQGSATTWTGLSEDFDASIDGGFGQHTGAGDDFASAQTNLTILCNSTATVEPVGIFASWGPPGAPSTRPCFIGGGFFGPGCIGSLRGHGSPIMANVLRAPRLLRSFWRHR